MGEAAANLVHSAPFSISNSVSSRLFGWVVVAGTSANPGISPVSKSVSTRQFGWVFEAETLANPGTSPVSNSVSTRRFGWVFVAESPANPGTSPVSTLVSPRRFVWVVVAETSANPGTSSSRLLSDCIAKFCSSRRLPGWVVGDWDETSVNPTLLALGSFPLQLTSCCLEGAIDEAPANPSHVVPVLWWAGRRRGWQAGWLTGWRAFPVLVWGVGAGAAALAGRQLGRLVGWQVGWQSGVVWQSVGQSSAVWQSGEWQSRSNNTYLLGAMGIVSSVIILSWPMTYGMS